MGTPGCFVLFPSQLALGTGSSCPAHPSIAPHIPVALPSSAGARHGLGMISLLGCLSWQTRELHFRGGSWRSEEQQIQRRAVAAPLAQAALWGRALLVLGWPGGSVASRSGCCDGLLTVATWGLLWLRCYSCFDDVFCCSLEILTCATCFLQWQVCEIIPVFGQTCVCHLQFWTPSLGGDADGSVLISSGNINA